MTHGWHSTRNTNHGLELRISDTHLTFLMTESSVFYTEEQDRDEKWAIHSTGTVNHKMEQNKFTE